MSVHVVVINGYPGVGKDTFVTMCRTQAPKGTRVHEIHASDPAKNALKTMGYKDEDKTDPEIRDLLAQMISVSNRRWDTVFNYIVNVMGRINSKYKNDFNVLFIHEREPKNILRLKNKFNAYTLLLYREGFSILTDITNDADKNVLDFDYDLEIGNNTTLDYLSSVACDFITTVQRRF